MSTSARANPRLVEGVFEEHPVPTLIVDRDFVVHGANLVARELLGGLIDVSPLYARRAGGVLSCVRSEEPGGCGRQDACRRCAIRQAVSDALATGETRRAKVTLTVRREGTASEARMLVRVAPVGSWRSGHALLTLEDVTNVFQLQEELRYQRDLIQGITQHAAAPVFLVDPAGRVFFANGEAESTFGFSFEELKGRVLHDVLHRRADEGQSVPARECPVVKAQRQGRVLRNHADLFFRKDGWAVTVSCSTGPLAMAGKHEGSVLIVHDVTERRRSERKLRHNEARLRALIEDATEMLVLLDRRARIKFCSPSALQVLGRPWQRVCGRGALEFVHPDDWASIRGAYKDSLPRPRDATRLVVRVRCRDDSWRLIEVVARNLLNDPAVRGVVASARDVTDQRRLEEQLQASQRLESIGRLAGGIAHDFNNLLTVILSGAESLKASLDQDERSDPAIAADIYAAGDRARMLTRQLLTFARRQVIAPIPLDLNVLVRGSETLLRRILGEDVLLATSLQPDLWPVRCDPGQIEQIILNLAVNARDAMPSGGGLTIETSNDEIDGNRAASLPWMSAGSYVRLAVRDTGHGMTPEVRARIFEPFFTTKPQGKGTGLGLAMVYGIVKQNEGYILVESRPGRGTSFEIYFPRISSAAIQVPVPDPPVGVGGTEKILVVEDDPHVREVTVRALRAGGYTVLVAGNGLEALDVAAREQGPLDLVVTDVIMPGLDGLTMSVELRQRRHNLRVLFLSGHADEFIARHGILEPGIEFMAKPFRAASLLARVRTVLDGRGPLA